MLRRLERKARAEAPGTLVLRAPAEDLPFEDHRFDTVVSTLVLCGVDDQPAYANPPGAAPGGQLAFPRTSTVHRRQDGQEAGPHERYQPVRGVLRLQPANPRHDERGRLHVTSMQHTSMPKAPSFVRPAIVGTAKSPATVAAGVDGTFAAGQ